MSNPEARDKLEQLYTTHRKRLSILLDQRARFGIYVPDYIVLEIHNVQAEIKQLAAALGEAWEGDEAGLSDTAARRDFYAHIHLPAGYISRTALLAQVRACLTATPPLQAGSPAAVAPRAVVLHGMGGIGKSVVARALCHDPAIQASFPDGILWATIGQTPDLVGILRAWVQALGGIVADAAPTIESLRGNLANMLRTRACLLIADDVWKRSDAQIFQVGGPRCQLLLTTRDQAIADGPGVTLLRLPVMEHDESIALLDAWVGEWQKSADRALKAQIVDRLGALPLAIKLAGAQLRRSDPAEWLAGFDVRRLANRRPETAHDSLEQTFRLSFDTLPARHRYLYTALAIFPEDEAIAEIGIRMLWEGLDGCGANESAELIDDLAAQALLEVYTTAGRRAVVLHDIPRELIALELGAPGRLRAHRALLRAYYTTQRGQGWHSVPDDGYFYNHLAYHLQALSAHDQFVALFANQHWMQARLAHSDYDYDGFLDDIYRAGAVARERVLSQIQSGERLSAIADLFRFMLIGASINSLAYHFRPNVVARAVELGLWQAPRALSRAKRYSMPIDRALIGLCILDVTRPDAPSHQKARAMVLEALHFVDDPASQEFQLGLRKQIGALTGISILVRLAHSDTEAGRNALLLEALTRARGLAAGAERARALGVVAGQLPEPLRSAVLAEALAAEPAQPNQLIGAPAESRQDRLLAQPHATTWLEETLGVAPENSSLLVAEEDIEELYSTLAELARLPSDQERAAIVAELKSRWDDKRRANVLAALAHRLEPAQIKPAIAVLDTIADNAQRDSALNALAFHLNREQLQHELERARSIDDETDQALLLGLLATQLEPPDTAALLRRALQLVGKLRDETERVDVLRAISPYLRDDAVDQALALVAAFTDDQSRADGLLVLAPFLSSASAQRVLAQIKARADLLSNPDSTMVLVLRALIPRLGEQALPSALELTRTISDFVRMRWVMIAFLERYHSDAREALLREIVPGIKANLKMLFHDAVFALLWDLAPYLRGDDLRWAIDYTRSAWPSQAHAKALIALANHVDAPEREQLLEEARQSALQIYEAFVDHQIRLLTEIAGKVEEPARRAIGEELLEILRVAKGRSYVKFEALLAAAAPLLSPDLLAVAVSDAAQTANALDKYIALLALAPRPTDALLREAYRAADAKIEYTSSFKIIAALTKHIGSSPQLLPDIRRYLAHLLEDLAHIPRARALQTLHRYEQINNRVLDRVTIAAIAEHVHDVCGTWHWL